MIAIVLSIVAFCVLVAEFWTGIAVVGWSGDNLVIERKKSPGPYWFTMALHTLIGVGLPVLFALSTQLVSRLIRIDAALRVTFAGGADGGGVGTMNRRWTLVRTVRGGGVHASCWAIPQRDAMDRTTIVKWALFFTLLLVTLGAAWYAVARVGTMVSVFRRVPPDPPWVKVVESPALHVSFAAGAVVFIIAWQLCHGVIRFGRLSFDREASRAVFWLIVVVETTACALLLRIALTLVAQY